MDGGEDHFELEPNQEEDFKSIVRMLLAEGLDINQQGRSDGTLIDQAIKAGHLSAVRILFNIGVNLDVQPDALQSSASRTCTKS